MTICSTHHSSIRTNALSSCSTHPALLPKDKTQRIELVHRCTTQHIFMSYKYSSSAQDLASTDACYDVSAFL
jgi:hypothetical protein